MGKYYQEHKKEILTQQKEYQKEHKQEIKERTKIYQKTLKFKEYKKEYDKKNKGRFKEQHKKYLKEYRKTPIAIYQILRGSARERWLDFSFTFKDFNIWYNKQEQKCIYCNRTLEEIKNDNRENDKYKHRLTIDRKNNAKGYILSNIGLACYRCNTIKGEYFTEQEMIEIGKTIYQNTGMCYTLIKELNTIQKEK